MKLAVETTDYYWDRLDGTLPGLAEFADLFEAGSQAPAATDLTTCDRE